MNAGHWEGCSKDGRRWRRKRKVWSCSLKQENFPKPGMSAAFPFDCQILKSFIHIWLLLFRDNALWSFVRDVQVISTLSVIIFVNERRLITDDLPFLLFGGFFLVFCLRSLFNSFLIKLSIQRKEDKRFFCSRYCPSCCGKLVAISYHVRERWFLPWSGITLCFLFFFCGGLIIVKRMRQGRISFSVDR